MEIYFYFCQLKQSVNPFGETNHLLTYGISFFLFCWIQMKAPNLNIYFSVKSSKCFFDETIHLWTYGIFIFVVLFHCWIQLESKFSKFCFKILFYAQTKRIELVFDFHYLFGNKTKNTPPHSYHTTFLL